MSNLIQRLMAQANCEANEVADLLNEAAEALAEKQVEAVPFAWHVCSVNKDGSLSLEFAAAWEEAAHEHINAAITESEIEDAASWVVRPAYHRPPARQPLSVQEVESIIAQHNYEIHGGRARYIVRRTEVAHGIGGEK